MKIKLYITLFAIVVFSCSKNKPDSNLVGHWTLDETVDDASSYESHGRIFGNPIAVEGAVVGKALEFNGDDYIEVLEDGGCPSQFRTLTTGTISLWFKVKPWDVATTILPILYYGKTEGCEDAFDATNGGMVIEVGHGGIFPSKNVFFTQYDKECEYPTTCFDSNDDMGIIEPEQWYHFVVVVGDDYNAGYLNGEEITSRRYNFSDAHDNLFFDDYVAHERMWIGKGYWKGKEVYFNGSIDDIRIYNKPFTSKEVNILFNEKS